MPDSTSIPPHIPTTPLRAVLASNLRCLRKAQHYSQEEFADHCGLHRTYIGSVERQERNVSLSTLEILSNALGVTVPELLTPSTTDNGQTTR